MTTRTRLLASIVLATILAEGASASTLFAPAGPAGAEARESIGRLASLELVDRALIVRGGRDLSVFDASSGKEWIALKNVGLSVGSTALATTGSSVLVVWTEAVKDGRQIRAAEFNLQGGLVGQVMTLAPPAATPGSMWQQAITAIAADGTYVVVFTIGDGMSLARATIRRGSLVGAMTAIEGAHGTWPLLVSREGQPWLAWLQGRGMGDVHLGRLVGATIEDDLQLTTDGRSGAFALASVGGSLTLVHDRLGASGVEQHVVLIDPATGAILRTEGDPLAGSGLQAHDPSLLATPDGIFLVRGLQSTGGLAISVAKLDGTRVTEIAQVPVPGVTEIVSPMISRSKQGLMVTWADDMAAPRAGASRVDREPIRLRPR